MFPQLDNYDWAEVFGEGGGGNCTAILPNIQPPFSSVSAATFSREDVAEIFQMQDGERDEKEWIIYGQLKDGRYFAARGGCDYTGWDCQACNSGDVSASLSDIQRYGLSDDERQRFNITLPDSPAPAPISSTNK